MKYLFNIIVILVVGTISMNAQDCVDAEPGATVWYRDVDNDNYGNSNLTTCSVNKPAGYVAEGGDCNDNNSAIFPKRWYNDGDGDDYGDENAPGFWLCYQNGPPAGATVVDNNDDCNDAESSVYPGAPELCDGLDNDCDGTIDEGAVSTPTSNYVSVIDGCTSVTLSWSNNNLPNGVSWYWQSSASGTSTGQGNPIQRTTGSTYYLRAKTGSCWSPALAVSYDVSPPVINLPNLPDKQVCAGSNVNFNPTYIVPNGEAGASHFKWYNSVGTFIADIPVGGSINHVINGNTSFQVAAVVSGCLGERRTVNVSLYASLGAGTIGTVPNVCYNGNPGVISNASSATGGSGSYAYQWESSPNNSNWSAINGATQVTYDPPALTASRWYRRKVSSCTSMATSNTVKITVYNEVTPGSIAGDTSVCAGTVPGILQNTAAATGGNGSYNYQWQYLNNGSWENVSGATGASYTPNSPLSTNRTYRRRVNSCDSTYKYSNPFVINVTPPLTAPVSGNFIPVCGNTAAVLSATPDPNADTIKWYSAASGGTYLGEGSITRGEGDYYAASYNIGTSCESSARTKVSVRSITEITWYVDNDEDNYADTLSGAVVACQKPAGKWTQIETLDNCVGEQSFTNVLRTWYEDTDGDNLGNPAVFIERCEKPNGYVSDNSDLCPGLFSQDNSCVNSNSEYPYADFDKNYVYTRTYQKSTEEMGSGSDTSLPFFQENTDLIQQITYFDGLGRPIQQTGIDQSPNASGDFGDIVSHIEYDGYGRMVKEFLPYATTEGDLGVYRQDALVKTTDFYDVSKYQNTTNPYAEKVFEPSQLGRVFQQGAPGADWQVGNGHEIEFAYMRNDSIVDEVRRFRVILTMANNTYEPSLAFGVDLENETMAYYASGELSKSITKDENHSGSGKNHTTEEFTDKSGRVLLKRTYADTDLNADGDTSDTGEQEVRHDTYYVYDDFGNLTYVLPPMINASDSNVDLGDINGQLADFGYTYVYDYRNRLVEKQIPGKGVEYIVYNRLDQPVMTQDANQRAKSPKEWSFTMYDVLGRVVMTGLANNNETRVQAQTATNNIIPSNGRKAWVSRTTGANIIGGASVYYSNDSYPKATISEVLTVNYYDSYVDLPSGAPTSITPLGAPSSVSNTNEVRGLATNGKVKVLGADQWINTVTYYDDKGRPVYTYSKNDFLGTTDVVETELDFVGKPLKSRTAHARNGATVVTIDNFTYDAVGRLITQTQCIGNSSMGDSCPTDSGNGVVAELNLTGQTVNSIQVASQKIFSTDGILAAGTRLLLDASGGATGTQELIVQNHYDDLGQLDAKKVGGAAQVLGNGSVTANGLQQVDYKYNVRGWLTDINDISDASPDKLFTFGIAYNEGPNALYNGNISGTQWRSANQDSSLKSYQYSYDALNRITDAVSNGSGDRYGLSDLSYDRNGNIQRLKRNGHTNTGATAFGVMDELTYTYSGNQLQSVTDSGAGTGFMDGNTAGDDYGYDQNGNLTSDLNKGITLIEYNHLNLPTKVTLGGGTIDYVYDATGIKQRKTVSTGTTTEYAGNYIYENSDLKQFSHSEGYVEVNGTGDYDYVYSYLDHLGTVRLTYSDFNGNGSIETATEILQERNTYPFGLEHKGYNNVQNGTESNYQTYLGQELNKELGLNWLTFRYRNYDASIGRFFGVDPITEDFPNQTPYQFASNNPIWKIELEGLEGFPTTEEDYINGFGYGVDPGGSTPKNSYGSSTDSGAIGSFFSAVGDVLGAAHDAISGAITDGIVAITGTASSNNTLSDSQFNDAVGSGDENAFFTGLEQESAAALNALPEIAGEAGAIVIESVVLESAAGFIGPKLPSKTTSPASVTGAETLSPGKFANGSIPARSTARNFTQAERNAVNKIGAESGCHNCGTTTAGTKSGNFILDHQPPSALVPEGTPQSLYPHCTNCSSKQGGTVSGIVRKRNN